jgi:hypothetical protein
MAQPWAERHATTTPEAGRRRTWRPADGWLWLVRGQRGLRRPGTAGQRRGQQAAELSGWCRCAGGGRPTRRWRERRRWAGSDCRRLAAGRGPGAPRRECPRRRAAVDARHAALLHGSLQGKSGQVRVGLPVVWAAAPRARRRKVRPQAAAQRCEYRTVSEERSGLGGAGMGAPRDRPGRLLAGDRVQRHAEGTPVKEGCPGAA